MVQNYSRNSLWWGDSLSPSNVQESKGEGVYCQGLPGLFSKNEGS